MEEVDASNWQQGDVVTTSMSLPVTAPVSDDQPLALVPLKYGAVLITQTCEIVRSDRDFLQVAALVEATDVEIERARSGQSPSKLFLPSLESEKLLVDLDLIGTIERADTVSWNVRRGLRTDFEQRAFAAGLGRHRTRFAFPDHFSETVLKPARRWVEKKRKAASGQGDFIRATAEYRVFADDWAHLGELTFFVILNQDPTEEVRQHWKDGIRNFTAAVTQEGYPVPDVRLVTYDDISAREYLTSDRLDWDGLSDV